MHRIPLFRLAITVFATALASWSVSAQPAAVQAAQGLPTQPWQALDQGNFAAWSGLTPAADGSAGLSVPGEAAYTVANGPRGYYSLGLWPMNDGTIDARQWYGLRLDVKLDRDDAAFEGSLTIAIPPETGRENLLPSARAPLVLQGRGWHTITVPFTAFDYNRGQGMFLAFLKTITLAGHYAGPAAAGKITLRNVRLVRGNVLHLAAYIRSQPADADQTVAYTALLTNCTEAPQTVTLSLEHSGWEGMPATVSPDRVSLPAGESKTVTVNVTVPAWMPGGAREKQVLVATPQGDPSAAEKLEFTTLRRLPSPYLLHTPAEWAEVKAKIANNPWAKDELAAVVKQAESFEVPVVPVDGVPSDQDTPAVFKSYIERKLLPCAVDWKLTGDRRQAEKIALFLRRLADPETGYPKRLHLNSQGIPQEGGLWEACAWSYDLIRDAGVLSDDDKRLIEQSFRLYIDWVSDGLGNGGISNWSVFNLCPAAQCALAIQDMERFDTLMNGPCGVIDHLRYGVMDDGWWYEMSLSYNLGCAEAFTNLGLAARPFGINFLHEQFPVATTRIVGLRPFEFKKFLGMAFGKYGPVRDNTVSVKKMWDGIVDYPDYRGVMFGMGDGHEDFVASGHFEKAYYAFRDPAYAAIIKQGGSRNLLYGVAELPADTPKPYTLSAHSDDAGLAVLRSQTPKRPQRGQIQAVLKYGTHGSYHGHFDRMDLVSLMRCGRSFYNPETSWYGYASYMYKWWVQPSLSHNMVVVDSKMQEPSECSPLLFHAGAMMQVAGAETTTRWSNPPYLGGYDQIADIKGGNRPYVAIPADHPKPGDVTGFTEPVRQRRVLIVTDDYVVLADDLQGDREHTFDNLLHLRGARLAAPDKLGFLRHDDQFDTDPLGSGQFITNVDRYSATAPVIIRSIHRVADKKGGGVAWNSGDSLNWETGGASSLSVPGELQIDEHVLWPQRPEIAIGDYAESWRVNKKLAYEVQGDGRKLAGDTFGAWILGCGQIDADVRGVKTLRLATHVTDGRDTLNTVFWGDAVLITSAGKEIPLSSLKTSVQNVLPASAPGRDYAGGPIRIAGRPITHALPAEPKNDKEDAVISIDLSGLDAVRFKARVGGDWPVGNEEQLRKVCDVRTTGRHAQFLTLIEPYENKSAIKSAEATGPDRLRVALADGRVQEIRIANLADAGNPVSVTITETRDGKTVRTETAAGS